MPRPKGLPKTGGKKKGSKNKRTREIELRSEGQVPLDYMLQVMRDETADPLRRDEMAKAAAPYVHAKRAPETKEGETPTYTLVIRKDE
jgi:hypothetical protein